MFSVTTDKEGILNWRIIEEALKKQFDVYTPYARFSKVEGNFILNKNKTSEDLIKRVFI